MKRKFVFKDYFVGWIFYMLFNFITGIVAGITLGLMIPTLPVWIIPLISILVSSLVMYGVAEWRDLSFWKLLLFTIIANIVITIILLAITFVLIIMI